MDREVMPGQHVSLEEYLATVHEYEVEPDFVDDHLETRCIGEYEHSSAMTAILFALHEQKEAVDCHALNSLSLRVSPARIRIVDVCLLPRRSRMPIPDWPPLLCVEVMGSEDTLEATASRCRDYFAMGVPNVWIADPWKRECFALKADGILCPADVLYLEGSRITVASERIFADD